MHCVQHQLVQRIGGRRDLSGDSFAVHILFDRLLDGLQSFALVHAMLDVLDRLFVLFLQCMGEISGGLLDRSPGAGGVAPP